MDDPLRPEWISAAGKRCSWEPDCLRVDPHMPVKQEKNRALPKILARNIPSPQHSVSAPALHRAHLIHLPSILYHAGAKCSDWKASIG